MRKKVLAEKLRKSELAYKIQADIAHDWYISSITHEDEIDTLRLKMGDKNRSLAKKNEQIERYCKQIEDYQVYAQDMLDLINPLYKLMTQLPNMNDIDLFWLRVMQR